MNIYIIVGLIIAIIYFYRLKQETFEVLCKMQNESSPVPMGGLSEAKTIETALKSEPLFTFENLNRYPWRMK